MSPLTLIFPSDRPGDATYAGIAAQIEAGLARVVLERRGTTVDRRLLSTRRFDQKPLPVGVGGRRGLQRRQPWARRQAAALPVSPRIVVTP